MDVDMFMKGFRAGESATASSMVACTPPEVAKALSKNETIPAAASMDVWGVGHVVYFLATSTPFWPVSYSEQDIFNQLAQGAFSLPYGVDKAILRLIKPLLTVDPSDRSALDEFKVGLQLKYSMQDDDQWEYIKREREVQLRELQSQMAGTQMTVDKVVQVFDEYGGIVDAAYAHHGRWLATAADMCVTVWDTENWTKEKTFQHASKVHAVSWHPHDERLLVGCDDGISIWDVAAQKCVTSVQNGRTHAVAWMPDGNRYVCGDGNGNVTLHVLHTSSVTYHFPSGFNVVTGLVVSNASSLVAIASNSLTKQYRMVVLSIQENEMTVQSVDMDGLGYWPGLSLITEGRFVLVSAEEAWKSDLWDVQTHTLVKEINGVTDASAKHALLGVGGKFFMEGGRSMTGVYG
jgi:WD40 repeat protein